MDPIILLNVCNTIFSNWIFSFGLRFLRGVINRAAETLNPTPEKATVAADFEKTFEILTEKEKGIDS